MQKEMPSTVPAPALRDSAVLSEAFAQLPRLLDLEPNLIRRGAYFDARFRVEIGDTPFNVKIESGRIAAFERGPFLMRSWRFAVRGTAEAWSAWWAPIPLPGWHDMFALTKKGRMTLEGDLQPAMANLQYLKDLLVLPRQLSKGP